MIPSIQSALFFFRRPWLLAGCLLVVGMLTATASTGQAAGLQRVAVVLSMKIHPYLQAVEGIQTQLEGRAQWLQVFPMERSTDTYLQALKIRIADARADVLIAVGPEATRFVWSQHPAPDADRLFTMVLNPERMLPPGGGGCGISLNVPAGDQLRGLAATAPALKKIGLIYDPAHNADFSRQAMAAGAARGIEIVPLAVADRKQITDVLDSNWSAIQGLWMIPDATVITESLVRHIIKAAIVNRVAVIGFNRFFLDSGAALSVVLDYTDIGRQTADLAWRIKNGETCHIASPRFQTLTNRKVLDMLRIEDESRSRVVGPAGETRP